MTERIAFLACEGTLPGSRNRRYDAFEHDHQVAALRAGLAGRGVELVEIGWRAELAELTGFAMAIIGTPWDYTEAKDAFLARLAAMAAAGVRLCNPLDVVHWNIDKRYLKELAGYGVASIPTLWPDNSEGVGEEVADVFAEFGCDRVVVKQRIGAGAVGQACFTRGDPAITAWCHNQPVMIQPFLPAIESEGEISFIFVDGQFSHALVKRAKPGDYRVQACYGGVEAPITPGPRDHAAATRVMAALPFTEAPLYARIDMVRLADGHLALMEAELIEPYLYPLQGPAWGTMMAAALLRRLA